MSRGLLFVALLVVAGTALGQETTNGTEHSTRHPDDNLIGKSTEKPAAPVLLPEPVVVTHGVGIQSDSSQQPQAEIQRVEIDHDGVPIIHGVVMPDDPNDTKIWRNGRVLNNVFLGKEEQIPSQDHQGDMFVYRPQSARILNDDVDASSFQPSQSDTFAPSLPYPAFYYQRYYQDKDTKEHQQLPDTVAVETSENPESESDATAAEEQEEEAAKLEEDIAADVNNQTDGRGFANNNKRYKKTGLNKLTPGSSIGYGARPISYYVPQDDAKAIHDDRSPYDYEPAQQNTNYYTNEYTGQQSAAKQDYQYYNQQQQAPHRTGLYQQNSFLSGNVVPAPADSFVIREQTYNSGGQSFTVPIPVPKDQYAQQQYGQQYAQPQYGQYTQYPQYQYQYQNPGYQQQAGGPGQQPLDFLGAKLKEQVQKARDKFHDMTDPVVDPLMEAGQKISTNLGLPERVHKINEKVATPSVLVPLAMAGGAALALGGLSTAIALSNSNATSAFKNLGFKNSPLVDRLSTLKVRVRRSEDEVADEPSEYDDEKENLLDRVMSSLNGPQRVFLSQLQRSGFDSWQRTPCAKRIFCDVMIQQSDDAIALMEKRMSTFLTLLDGGVADTLQALTSDVMDGIRRRNCQAFVCSTPEQQEHQQSS